jgi:hypothetical protein
MLELLFLSLFERVLSLFIYLKKVALICVFVSKITPTVGSRDEISFLSFTEDLILKIISLFPLIICLVTLIQVVKNSIFFANNSFN